MKPDRVDDPGRWSSEELLLRVAWYYYKDELTQDEIARRLSMSRASVGRLLDRIGDADEVARWIALLLSPVSSFMTEAVIPLDGGQVIPRA